MDKQAPNRQEEEFEPSRPGPKTLVAVIVVVLCIAAYYNWPVIKAALPFI